MHDRDRMLPLHQHIVYGPIRSRRLGRSLGVNLLPAGLKVCNMNCAYCQYGWTHGAQRLIGHARRWPTPASIAIAVESRLTQSEVTNELIDRLTIAGHGEPTLHPDFEEIVKHLKNIRDRISPRIRLAVLSNSTTAAKPDVRRGLVLFDERYMKLDAGDPITCARVNGLGLSVAETVDALTSLPAVIVQTMFVTDDEGNIDNTTQGAVSRWLAALKHIKPASVHIYTLDRAPAKSSLKAVPVGRLREIAERVRSTGIPAEVFPGQN